MGVQCDELVAKLYAEYNSGQMPVELKMAYPTFCELMKDEDFEEQVNYETSPVSFQGLPIIFDSWYKTVKIVTKPIDKVWVHESGK